MIRTILSVDGNELWRGDAATVCDAVCMAVRSRADLSRANLTGANLSGADLWEANLLRANLTGADLSRANLLWTNLSGADLSGADLSGADLWEANLLRANLTGADLLRANLTGTNLSEADLTGTNLSEANLLRANLLRANLLRANLTGADLWGANLSEANLTGANLTGAFLGAPVMVLLASWGNVSADLCSLLMRYDAANHPEGVAAFSRWAKSEDHPCPYSNHKIARVANFSEQKEYWNPDAPVLSAYDLMVRVILEKCAASDFHVIETPMGKE